MIQCPVCDKVYDESEYSQCPYCSGELGGRNYKGSGIKIKMYDKELEKYRWVTESEYEEDPDRYE